MSHAPLFSRPDSTLLRLELRDNGNGYPDLTANDGVYSGYITQFADQPGSYSVKVTAINAGLADVPILAGNLNGDQGKPWGTKLIGYVVSWYH